MQLHLHPMCASDMPLASAGKLVLSRDRPGTKGRLSNTRPLHHRNSVGTRCVQRVAQ